MYKIMSDKIMQLDESVIRHGLKGLINNGVEETLNALIDRGTDECFQ